jgi:hypothetical protein
MHANPEVYANLTLVVEDERPVASLTFAPAS